MQLSVVIPIYKNAQNAIQQIKNVLKFLNDEYSTFELIFIIDDKNIDAHIVKSLLIDDHVSLYFLDRNHGQHFATLCGYYIAKGEYIMSIDEDMMQYIPQISTTDVYKENEVVYFNYNKYDMYKSSIRRILSKLFNNTFLLISGIKYHSSFRVISKNMRDNIVNQKRIFYNLDIMLQESTDNIIAVPLNTNGLTDARSSYNFKALTTFAFKFIYESNPVLLAALFLFLPAVLFYFYTYNINQTIAFYAVTVVMSAVLIFISKKISKDTKSKIEQALSKQKIKEVALNSSI